MAIEDAAIRKAEQPVAGLSNVRKKTYAAPRLTTYGHISKLTMAFAGSGADIGTMATRMKMCL